MEINPELLRKIEEAVSMAPPEMQEEKLQEELSKLPPEMLKQLQTQQCPFCLMSENKIPTQTVFENINCKAVLEINPAHPGHVLLFPKKHLHVTSELNEDQTKEIFNIANNISKSLLKIYPATNIYISNGKDAGQKFDHVVIHIIPRQEKDQVYFMWQPKKAEQKELEEMKQKIVQNLPKEELVIVPKIESKVADDKELVMARRLP